MGHVNSLGNVIGSGSYLSATLTETHAADDIIINKGDARVKVDANSCSTEQRQLTRLGSRQ